MARRITPSDWARVLFLLFLTVNPALSLRDDDGGSFYGDFSGNNISTDAMDHGGMYASAKFGNALSISQPVSSGSSQGSSDNTLKSSYETNSNIGILFGQDAMSPHSRATSSSEYSGYSSSGDSSGILRTKTLPDTTMNTLDWADDGAINTAGLEVSSAGTELPHRAAMFILIVTNMMLLSVFARLVKHFLKRHHAAAVMNLYRGGGGNEDQLLARAMAEREDNEQADDFEDMNQFDLLNFIPSPSSKTSRDTPSMGKDGLNEQSLYSTSGIYTSRELSDSEITADKGVPGAGSSAKLQSASSSSASSFNLINSVPWEVSSEGVSDVSQDTSRDSSKTPYHEFSSISSQNSIRGDFKDISSHSSTGSYVPIKFSSQVATSTAGYGDSKASSSFPVISSLSPLHLSLEPDRNLAPALVGSGLSSASMPMFNSAQQNGAVKLNNGWVFSLVFASVVGAFALMRGYAGHGREEKATCVEVYHRFLDGLGSEQGSSQLDLIKNLRGKKIQKEDEDQSVLAVRRYGGLVCQETYSRDDFAAAMLELIPEDEFPNDDEEAPKLKAGASDKSKNVGADDEDDKVMEEEGGKVDLKAALKAIFAKKKAQRDKGMKLFFGCVDGNNCDGNKVFDHFWSRCTEALSKPESRGLLPASALKDLKGAFNFFTSNHQKLTKCSSELLMFSQDDTRACWTVESGKTQTGSYDELDYVRKDMKHALTHEAPLEEGDKSFDPLYGYEREQMCCAIVGYDKYYKDRKYAKLQYLQHGDGSNTADGFMKLIDQKLADGKKDNQMALNTMIGDFQNAATTVRSQQEIKMVDNKLEDISGKGIFEYAKWRDENIDPKSTTLITKEVEKDYEVLSKTLACVTSRREFCKEKGATCDAEGGCCLQADWEWNGNDAPSPKIGCYYVPKKDAATPGNGNGATQRMLEEGIGSKLSEEADKLRAKHNPDPTKAANIVFSNPFADLADLALNVQLSKVLVSTLVQASGDPLETGHRKVRELKAEAEKMLIHPSMYKYTLLYERLCGKKKETGHWSTNLFQGEKSNFCPTLEKYSWTQLKGTTPFTRLPEELQLTLPGRIEPITPEVVKLYLDEDFINYEQAEGTNLKKQPTFDELGKMLNKIGAVLSYISEHLEVGQLQAFEDKLQMFKGMMKTEEQEDDAKTAVQQASGSSPSSAPSSESSSMSSLRSFDSYAGADPTNMGGAGEDDDDFPAAARGGRNTGPSGSLAPAATSLKASSRNWSPSNAYLELETTTSVRAPPIEEPVNMEDIKTRLARKCQDPDVMSRAYLPDHCRNYEEWARQVEKLSSTLAHRAYALEKPKPAAGESSTGDQGEDEEKAPEQKHFCDRTVREWSEEDEKASKLPSSEGKTRMEANEEHLLFGVLFLSLAIIMLILEFGPQQEQRQQ